MRNNQSKTIKFLKDNLLYLILTLCLLAIGASIVLMAISKSRNATLTNVQTAVVSNDGEGETPTPSDVTQPEPVVNVIAFTEPVENATKIVEYSETMVYNSTLNRYTAHKAIDYYASEGSSVCAVYAGTVTSVDNTLLTGVTVTIDHGNGLCSVYNSLADVDYIKVGTKVEQGEIIGQVSVTNRQEAKEGAHLHFSVTENGNIVDPGKYFIEDLK